MDHQYTPPRVDFTECVADIEYRYQQIVSMLEEYECIVNFKKLNGEIRSMPCTLKEGSMPVAAQVINEDVAAKPTNYETITVWCTDKQAWRAMKTANVISVEIAPKAWTVLVEEDPETGESILPLPAELLSAQGWADGDILDWHDNGDGSFTLTKVK